jgi:hypothetical protein
LLVSVIERIARRVIGDSAGIIQLAWLWLRNQPHSALALWFKDRVSRNGGRLKKTTIVALARGVLQTHTERSSI